MTLYSKSNFSWPRSFVPTIDQMSFFYQIWKMILSKLINQELTIMSNYENLRHIFYKGLTQKFQFLG